MIRGLGAENDLNLFSNFKWVRSPPCMTEGRTRQDESAQWATFGKQNWRCGIKPNARLRRPMRDAHETP
ncbi:hypothetical protein JTE90_002692 [Oedothorax gibbosus]|uniref:Uncharacterized protein n=1 Tax=Oedothorax gibbosus TaxID=931172 RepID=A0AAV6THG1_9ARAC|nr:hypothetical protein JTE90_002692 [Oedothorax gibbosus]